MRRYCILICGPVFLAVAAAHLARLTPVCEIEIAGWTVPHWISVPGADIPGAHSAWGFALAHAAGDRVHRASKELL